MLRLKRPVNSLADCGSLASAVRYLKTNYGNCKEQPESILSLNMNWHFFQNPSRYTAHK